MLDQRFVSAAKFFGGYGLVVDGEPSQASDELPAGISRVARLYALAALATFCMADVVRFVAVFPPFLAVLNPYQGGSVVGNGRAIVVRWLSVCIPAMHVPALVCESPRRVGTMEARHVDRFAASLEDVTIGRSYGCHASGL
jgi:hypothetical protein